MEKMHLTIWKRVVILAKSRNADDHLRVIGMEITTSLQNYLMGLSLGGYPTQVFQRINFWEEKDFLDPNKLSDSSTTFQYFL